MATFTSGTQARDRRTVNHDPEPWVHTWPDDLPATVKGEGNPFRCSYEHCSLYGCFETYAPRLEFVVLDNPILAAFRNQRRSSATLGELAGSWVSDIVNDHFLKSATAAEIKHATRVLALLAE